MAKKFESVKDINDAKDLWKIYVKVKEKWTNLKDGKESIELLVVDDKDGIHDPLDYPKDIDLIAGKTLAVKVKWQPKWKTGSVIQINQADDFINEISSQFPPTDDNNTAEFVPPNICEVEAEVELQPTTTVEDLRDVDDVIPTTPSKRSGNDLTSTSQDAEVEDLIGEKASSTKLLKVGGKAAGKRGPVAEPVLSQIIKSRGPNQSTRYEVDVWQQFCLDNYFSNGDIVKFTFFDLEKSNRVDVDRVIQ
ncbi:unnamed protein product [Trifolium pratense]|uniref:Uncharacterized protein n=1 Tax=Trifolium pratense TaxID=57577 RepID=A0ACB0KZ50_TRIPR|nr:unnamed protein product [Trifolium pratense]